MQLAELYQLPGTVYKTDGKGSLLDVTGSAKV